MPEKPTFRAILESRGFKFLWFNQILVQLATNFLNFALIIWVFKLLDTNLAVSILMLAIYLPGVLFGMFSGVFVDLFDRKKIILLIDLLLALSCLAFLFIKHSYPLILINVFFVNSLTQFFMPSESSSIPMLVPKKYLFLANSLFSLTLYGSFMLGFSIGGPILNHFGINTIFLLGFVMLILAFLVAYNLPQIKVLRLEKKYKNLLSFGGASRLWKIVVEESKETSSFIRGRLTLLVAIGILSSVQGIIGVVAVLLPSYLERVLKIHATDSSYFVMLPLGLGMVAGALIAGRRFHSLPRRSVVLPALLGVGLIFLLVGVTPTLAHFFQSQELPAHLLRPRYFFRAPSLVSLFALGAFILGFCTVSVIIPCQTVLQESTNLKNRGKIFAVLSVLMTGVSVVPIIITGVLADVFGVVPIFLALGIMICAVGLLALRPGLFFQETMLPFKIREFLGLGHWERIS